MEFVRALKALADPLRLRILAAVSEEELTVGEVQEIVESGAVVGLTQSRYSARGRVRPGSQGRDERLFFRAPKHARAGAGTVQVAAFSARRYSRGETRIKSDWKNAGAGGSSVHRAILNRGGGLGAHPQELFRRPGDFTGDREITAARSYARRYRLRHRQLDL